MFFIKHKSREVALIVDVSSDSVGAALVSISEGAKPKLVFSTRLLVALQNEPEKSRSLTVILQTLETVMKTVADQHIAVRKSHIIFSSPWYVSETNILKVDHDLPTLVTHHIIEKLTSEAEKKFVDGSHVNGKVVEHRIIRTRLNGYSTSDPYNKKAKTVEVTFFASIIAKDVLEPVLSVVEKYFHIRNNQVSSFSLAAWSAITGIFPDEQDFLIVDVRGDVTDLSLITGGALIKSLSFPQGKNTLINAVSNGLGQSASAAASLVNVALHGNGEPSTQTDVLKFAETFKQSWLEGYKKTLQEIYAGTNSPQTIFLIADSDTNIFFENILDEKNKRLNLNDYVETSSLPIDQFLALESIFVTMI